MKTILFKVLVGIFLFVFIVVSKMVFASVVPESSWNKDFLILNLPIVAGYLAWAFLSTNRPPKSPVAEHTTDEETK